MSVKPRLTETQKAMLGLIEHCKGLSLFGSAEFRTAKSLERKGLINIDLHDYATLVRKEQSA